MRLATENTEVQRLLRKGYRLVETDNEHATLVKPVEQHVLGNLVMTVLTLGLWLIPWAIGHALAHDDVKVVDLTATPAPSEFSWAALKAVNEQSKVDAAATRARRRAKRAARKEARRG